MKNKYTRIGIYKNVKNSNHKKEPHCNSHNTIPTSRQLKLSNVLFASIVLSGMFQKFKMLPFFFFIEDFVVCIGLYLFAIFFLINVQKPEVFRDVFLNGNRSLSYKMEHLNFIKGNALPEVVDI